MTGARLLESLDYISQLDRFANFTAWQLTRGNATTGESNYPQQRAKYDSGSDQEYDLSHVAQRAEWVRDDILNDRWSDATEGIDDGGFDMVDGVADGLGDSVAHFQRSGVGCEILCVGDWESSVVRRQFVRHTSFTFTITFRGRSKYIPINLRIKESIPLILPPRLFHILKDVSTMFFHFAQSQILVSSNLEN